MQYLALIHDDATTSIDPVEWAELFTRAQASPLFRGGSALAAGFVIGAGGQACPPLGGFLRFDAAEAEPVMALL